MRTIHRIALLAMMWVWIIPTANAQENLLKNGDFEGEWIGSDFERKPKGWKVYKAIGNFQNEKRDGGSGSKIFMAYLDNGGSISPIDETVESWRIGALPVEKGATYKLTVWHKCTNENLKFNVIFNFYQRTEDDDDWKGDKEYSFTTKKTNG